MNRLPVLLVNWVNWEDRSHWPSAPHWGLPLPFSTASNLSWFVKVCVSSFCLTSASTSSVHLPPQCAVSLQCCHPPAQEPSLCRFCHQEGDFSVTQSTWLQTVLSMQQCSGITCQLCCCTKNSRESRGVQSTIICIPLAALSLGDACLAAWAVSSLCPCVIFTAETKVSSSLARLRFESWLLNQRHSSAWAMLAFGAEPLTSRRCRLIGEEIWSFLCLAALIFHVYQMKIKVADSEGEVDQWREVDQQRGEQWLYCYFTPFLFLYSVWWREEEVAWL